MYPIIPFCLSEIFFFKVTFSHAIHLRIQWLATDFFQRLHPAHRCCLISMFSNNLSQYLKIRRFHIKIQILGFCLKNQKLRPTWQNWLQMKTGCLFQIGHSFPGWSPHNSWQTPKHQGWVMTVKENVSYYLCPCFYWKWKNERQRRLNVKKKKKRKILFLENYSRVCNMQRSGTASLICLRGLAPSGHFNPILF